MKYDIQLALFPVTKTTQIENYTMYHNVYSKIYFTSFIRRSNLHLKKWQCFLHVTLWRVYDCDFKERFYLKLKFKLVRKTFTVRVDYIVPVHWTVSKKLMDNTGMSANDIRIETGNLTTDCSKSLLRNR